MTFSEITIKETVEKLHNGELLPEEVLDTVYNIVEEKNTELFAFIELYDRQDADAQLENQKKRKQNGEDLPLFGVPVALKDNILYEGHIASSASKMLENYVATYTSSAVQNLIDAGAIIVGRTNMDEFAMGSSTEYSVYGPSKNPHDTTKVPGGTSGGSAVAVAAQMVPVALGSDTAGSIRQPGGFCGVVGLKPTYGAVSRYGLMAAGSSLDCIGPLTNTVEDTEIIHRVLSQYDESDATSAPQKVRDELEGKAKGQKPKKVGVLRSLIEKEGVSKDLQENFFSSIKALEEKGYEVVDIEIPYFEEALAMYYIVMPAEVSTNLSRYDGVRYGLSERGKDLLETYFKSRGAGFGDETRRRIMVGSHVLSAGYKDAYYNKATQAREMLREEFRKAFEKVDIIATPTSPTTAFGFGEKQDPVSMYLADVYTVAANMVGVPGIAVPTGKDDSGLPYSIQFMAPHFHEDWLFSIGKDVESQWRS